MSEYIIQLANVVTIKPRGDAIKIGAKYPHARVYAHRFNRVKGKDLLRTESWLQPGNIVVTKAKGLPSIITFYSQLNPGELGTHEYIQYRNETNAFESRQYREDLFNACLRSTAEWLMANTYGDPALLVFPESVNEDQFRLIMQWKDNFGTLFNITFREH